MNVVAAPADQALTELDRARKALGRHADKQVRISELRDLLKATALAWFRAHRPVLVAAGLDEALAPIDTAYKTILEATERAAANSTYEKAIKSAKAALVGVRSASLMSVKPNPIGEAAPSFAALAADSQMQAILARRWNECIACLQAGAPLASTVMMGGLLEALLVARANKLSDKSVLFKCKATPVDGRTKNSIDLRQWTLGPYIDVGYELGWISKSAKEVAAILRDYRNYVHPEKERSHGVTLSTDDAALFWNLTRSLSKELLAMKGAT